MFPLYGAVLNITGFNFLEYEAVPLWNQNVWTAIGIAAAMALSLYLALGLDRLWRWARVVIRSRRGESGWRGWWRSARRDPHPAAVLYLFGAGTALVTAVATIGLFDRYMLPVLPAVVVALLRRVDRPGQTLALRWLFLVPILAFSLVAQRDYAEHASVRWSAAQSLVAQGVPYDQVEAGFEWAGWYVYREAEQRLKQGGLPSSIIFPPYMMGDWKYYVSDRPKDGYTEVRRLPYFSWLDPGQARYVRVLQRNP
jgi:hypothetical protein